MRFVLFVAILCFTAAPIAQAKDAELESPSKDRPGRVQLVEDDKDGILRILFDAVEVAHCRVVAEKHIDCEVIDADAAILPVVIEPPPLPAETGHGAP